MKVILHQTDHTIADFNAIFLTIEEVLTKRVQGVHIFPELFLTGYPLQDLCLQKSFITAYLQHLENINKLSLAKRNEENFEILMGGLDYEFDNHGLPSKIENVIYSLKPGHTLLKLYTKMLLPNYDIFDEKKYFTEGVAPYIHDVQGKQIALQICEDMWPSSNHKINPIDELYKVITDEKIELDAIINLSASPFHLFKHSKRIERAKEISHLFGAPFVYVNRVGGEDEILFDGASFIVNDKEIFTQLKSFTRDEMEVELPKRSTLSSMQYLPSENTWESFFTPRIELVNGLPSLIPLTDKQCEVALAAINFGVKEYSKKCGFNKFVIALSGGIDSALVVAITKLIVSDSSLIEAIYMPGLFSNTISYELSYAMCKQLGIKLKTLPIKFMHTTIRNSFKDIYGDPLTGLADENIQSRLRGALLYARSNTTGALALNTSNKSELAVGYSTLYGDSVGGISMLGDLYKTEVFALSEFINKKFGTIIPEGIIKRPPSAELRENQKDEDSLPPYTTLDSLLECILSYNMDTEDLLKRGFNQAHIDLVKRLHFNSEYKRSQFCPIIKLKPKSFGFGHRVPICKSRF